MTNSSGADSLDALLAESILSELGTDIFTVQFRYESEDLLVFYIKVRGLNAGRYLVIRYEEAVVIFKVESPSHVYRYH